MKYLLMVVLLCSFSQARATGSFLAGDHLLEMCEAYISKTNAAKGNECLGYVMGVADAEGSFVDWELMEKRSCIPDKDIKSSQLVRVVTKYLQENPQYLHIAASDLVGNAFYLAFPCE